MFFFGIRAHLVRYAFVGLVCTAFQLVLFRLLLRYAVPPFVANSVAFLLSTQLNFTLSHRYTWAHRRATAALPPRQLLARCVAYNGAAVLGLGINAAAFYGCHSLLVLPPFTAAGAALTVSTVVTYLLSSRVIFVAARDGGPVPPAPHRPPATAVPAQPSRRRFPHQPASKSDWRG
jgi:putative flippase GtrA